jgi:hypothetical protein
MGYKMNKYYKILIISIMLLLIIINIVLNVNYRMAKIENLQLKYVNSNLNSTLAENFEEQKLLLSSININIKKISIILYSNDICDDNFNLLISVIKKYNNIYLYLPNINNYNEVNYKRCARLINSDVNSKDKIILEKMKIKKNEIILFFLKNNTICFIKKIYSNKYSEINNIINKLAEF